MPTIFDFLYREYCRARLAEMRKQLLISPKRHEVPEAFCDAKVAKPADGGETATQHGEYWILEQRDRFRRTTALRDCHIVVAQALQSSQQRELQDPV